MIPQARDFRGALEQAELTGRPVRFLRWGYELPVLSLEELSKRSVRRFASTGRYVCACVCACVISTAVTLVRNPRPGNKNHSLAYFCGLVARCPCCVDLALLRRTCGLHLVVMRTVVPFGCGNNFRYLFLFGTPFPCRGFVFRFPEPRVVHGSEER